MCVNNNYTVGVRAKSVDPQESRLQCQAEWELATVSPWRELVIQSDYPAREK